jgi:murein DD-endopeptidase MepM/ murein hydrolase activator NlpD
MSRSRAASRSARLLLAAVLSLAALTAATAALLTTPAHAAPTVADLRRQLESVRGQLRDVGASYDQAYWQLDESEKRIEELDGQIAQTERELDASQKALGARVDRMYRMDPVDYLNVLLGASSFQDLVTTLDFITRVGQADADAIQESKRLSAKLAEERQSAEAERQKRAAAFERLAAERERLKGKLSATQAEYTRVKKALDAQLGGPARQVAGVPSAGSGMVFPVQGVHYYSDTWGASRDGGRRSHQGTDIMAPRGTPCVAVLSGSMSTSYSGKGGQSIWLHADNGWTFYYAHLDGFAVGGGRVSAGQVIGYVGSTGNASGGAPHLHFEIHPGGGAAVNPYPYLRAME